MENKDLILFIFKLRLESGYYDDTYYNVGGFESVKVTDYKALERELESVGYSLETFKKAMSEYDFSDNAIFNRNSPINRILEKQTNEFLLEKILFIDRLRHDLLKKNFYPIDIIERYFKNI